MNTCTSFFQVPRLRGNVLLAVPRVRGVRRQLPLRSCMTLAVAIVVVMASATMLLKCVARAAASAATVALAVVAARAL